MIKQNIKNQQMWKKVWKIEFTLFTPPTKDVENV